MTYEQALRDLIRSDDRYVVMTAENRAAIRGLAEELGPRMIDVGICEQTLVGAAAGLALRGRVPVVHALAAFLTMRAFEFIRTDVGSAGLPVKLVGFVPGFLSEANGPTHQAVEDMALMGLVPGMTIFAPSDEEDLVRGLKPVLEAPGPAYIRFTSRPAGIPHREPFLLGRAEKVRSGRDVSFLSVGPLLEETLKAAECLEESGLSAGVWNMRTLRPFDGEAVEEAAAARLVVTVEDHIPAGGLGAAATERLARLGRPVRHLRFDLPRHYFQPALWPDLLKHEGFVGEAIAVQALRALA